MTLFNVRLGWWLGNPGPAGDRRLSKPDGPRVAIAARARDVRPTTDDRKYVYLSDGGHFENLGLYEMIRRRCRFIVVSDAGGDPKCDFEDLGNAVRKIAIDLGVYINFTKMRALKTRSKDNSVIEGAYYAVGVIDYKSAPEWNSGTQASAARPTGERLHPLRQTGLSRHGKRGHRRLCDRERDLPARDDGRSVFRQLTVRELPHARLRDHG